MNFIVDNTAFINPALRRLQEPDLQALSTKFKTNYSPVQFDHNVLASQMRTYQNDCTQYHLAGNCLIKFWCELHRDDYKELSSLALL